MEVEVVQIFQMTIHLPFKVTVMYIILFIYILQYLSLPYGGHFTVVCICSTYILFIKVSPFITSHKGVHLQL